MQTVEQALLVIGGIPAALLADRVVDVAVKAWAKRLTRKQAIVAGGERS
jgi:hypothetical protein